MENSQPLEGVTFTTTHRSAMTINCPADIDIDAMLMLLVEANASDFKFRTAAEHQFCVLTIHQNGAVKNRIGFPKSARERIPVILKESGKLALTDQHFQGRSQEKTKLTQFHIWSILNHFGFGTCCTITKTQLPQFDYEYNPNGKDKTRLPLNPEEYVAQRTGIGAKIWAWQVEFTCDMYNSRVTRDADGKWVGVNLEDQLISLLPDGLFLDSYCRKQGCIIWLALTCAL